MWISIGNHMDVQLGNNCTEQCIPGGKGPCVMQDICTRTRVYAIILHEFPQGTAQEH